MIFSSRVTETISMIYRTGDAYVDGRFVAGSETSESIIASVQRLTLAERQLLPEGFRLRETYKLYTETPTIQKIINDDPTIVDSAEFDINGKRYSMLGIEQWSYLLPHFKITVVEKQ